MQSKQAVPVANLVVASRRAARVWQSLVAGARAAKEASGEAGPRCGRLGPVLHSNAAVVAPRQGGHESSRVDSSARHHGGSSEASEGEATAQAEGRSRGETGGGETGNELEMGSGREGGQNACRSRYQGLAAPKEPPMVP
jgi:hypothetical protein